MRILSLLQSSLMVTVFLTTLTCEASSQRQDMPSQLVMESVRRPVTTEVSGERMLLTDYAPFSHAYGVNEDEINATCHYFESYLEKEHIEQARVEAIFGSKKEKLFDWVTRGWGLAGWLVGTSRNFAAISVCGIALFANIFPEYALALATASGLIEGSAALLYKMHDYCKKKRLNRIGYNLVVMNGQAAIRENKGDDFVGHGVKATYGMQPTRHMLEMRAMEEGRTEEEMAEDEEDSHRATQAASSSSSSSSRSASERTDSTRSSTPTNTEEED